MKRPIIEINEELCDGCGQCILDCAEGALELVNGKARLVGEIYCDGLGACLSGCPTGALRVVEREAVQFSEEAVKERERAAKASAEPLACGCPGSAAMSLKGPAATGGCPGSAAAKLETNNLGAPTAGITSELTHWPVKLELISPLSPFLRGADLIVLADCGAVSIPNLHRRFLKDRVVAIACPKFTDPDQTIARLAAVLEQGGVARLTVVHMEVPCCRGLVVAAQRALALSGADLELRRVKVGRDGRVQEEEVLRAPKAAI